MRVETWFLCQYEVDEIIRTHMCEVVGVLPEEIADVTFIIEDGNCGFQFSGAQVEFRDE